MWEYTFQHELHVNPEAVHMPVLITDSPLSSRENREQAAQIMFEKFRVPGFYVATQAVLSLFASGRTRGVVVESGDGVSHAVPVFEGYALPHAILRLDVAGSDITSHLRKMLGKEKPRDQFFKRMIDGLSDNVIRDIKENMCYVPSTNLDDELRRNPCEEKAYELPDGTIIEISQKCQATCGEILFNPSILGSGNPAPGTGIHTIVANAIAQCDSDLQTDLYGAVVIAGGTSMLNGFGRRLGNEIAKTAPSGMNIRIVPDVQNRERGYNSQRKYAAWVGGSMFSSLPTFGMVQITKREWEDSHEAIIHRKCF
jgi:actin-related protein